MKKLLLLFCTFLLAIAVMTGCGQTNSTNAKPTSSQTTQIAVEESGTYTDKDHVAAYIHKFKKLPANYITKKEAQKLGWKEGGTLDKVAPGKSIGGDHFGNFEKQVPDKQGRKWTECDIDYTKGNRGAKRIVFSNDGLIYYSDNHYKNFVKLYE
jgi:ribonuclease T1